MNQMCRVLILSMLSLGISMPASAHISLEQASNVPALKSRDGDGHTQLKAGPCGVAGSKRGTNIYTYLAGSTITIKVNEYVAHPSYFRIAFDSDGDDFTDPVSIKPQLASRGCPCTDVLAACTVANDHCTESDFYNSPEVLPNMDNLNPHTTAASGTEYTFEVALPNIPCQNCTLQIIQVMEDPAGSAHGPFDGLNDIYHQCLDLVLTPNTGDVAGTGGGDGEAGTGEAETGAGGSVGVGVSGSGGNGAAGTSAATAGTGGSAGTSGSTAGTGAPIEGAAGTAANDEGGCSAAGASSGTSSLAFVMLAIGLCAARRRERSARGSHRR